MTNPVEKFIAMFEPESEGVIAFRIMFEEALQYVKERSIPQPQSMNMRDQFAAQALQALVIQAVSENENPEVAAEAAYMFADAMMEARE